MSKRPPELSWEDKAILIAIPIVVFTIFVLANHFSQDVTVYGAFENKLEKAVVRDGGNIIQIYPEIATETISCRLQTKENDHEFDFVFTHTATDTIKFEMGRQIQFYGEYEYNEKGGTVTAPYQGKSGRMSGWAIYDSKRFAPKDEFEETPL